eukprot:CAMPEP_0119013026 /NCGR_PEP_ID=MMETSP1176-20130426/7755_1 /TAXON_ID=265551 /ORGANISM="Synedropsis recta cf, Strain CCMP1620" /LENGTH=394 /DNA_ID=CAMNT_0006966075 /DNA_START=97 /DNA_END=1281 /DNA_ORIENTATION=+
MEILSNQEEELGKNTKQELEFSGTSSATVCLGDDVCGTTLLGDQTQDEQSLSPSAISELPLFSLVEQQPPQYQEELGAITYQYSCLEEAQCEASRTGRPILCFEIQLPGDQDAGREIFSHPLVVEAAETLFVTVRTTPKAIAPSARDWTRVRVLDNSGIDVVVGISSNLLSLASMVSLMISGLNALRQPIPTYMLLLEDEETGRVRYTSSGCAQRTDRQAVFGMADSQIGEVEFGDLEGILSTRAGYIGHQQVVQVTYDSVKLCYCNLTRFALQRKIADIIYYLTNDEKIGARMETQRVEAKSDLIKHTCTIQTDVDPKHSLRQTMLRYVPMTDLQATKANRLVAMGVFNEAMHLLSPRQGEILMMSMKNATRQKFDDAVDVPIVRAWSRLSDQ